MVVVRWSERVCVWCPIHRECGFCKARTKKNPTTDTVAIPNTDFHHINGSFVNNPKCLS